MITAIAEGVNVAAEALTGATLSAAVGPAGAAVFSFLAKELAGACFRKLTDKAIDALLKLLPEPKQEAAQPS